MKTRAVRLAAAWWRHLAVGAVVELICVAGTVLASTHRGRHPDALGTALLLVAGGAVVFARRWPLPSLAASLGATGGYLGLGYAVDSPFFLGLVVTAYRSATADGRLRAAAFAAAAVAVLTVAALASGPVAGPEWQSVIVIVLAGLLAGQVVAEVGARAERRAVEAREEESRRRLAEERLRIARELHDVVSHSMAVINVRAAVASHVIDAHPEHAKEALAAIKETSQTAMRDLRSILGLMRESGEAEPLTPAPGLEHVPELVESIRRAGVGVSLEMDAPAEGVTAGAALAAYRVIQEALTNVVRHAPGTSATVSVRLRQGVIAVDVENGGRGSGAPQPGRPGAGHGLDGMRERIRAAGGSLEAGPMPGGGFSVRATLPALNQ